MKDFDVASARFQPEPSKDNEAELLAKALSVLNRCYHVLNNMTLENEGVKSIFWRWQISDEPLRHDARNLLPLINEVLGDD